MLFHMEADLSLLFCWGLGSAYVLMLPTILVLSRIRLASGSVRQTERDVSYSTNIDTFFWSPEIIQPHVPKQPL
jgi:hypothetical protein